MCIACAEKVTDTKRNLPIRNHKTGEIIFNNLKNYWRKRSLSFCRGQNIADGKKIMNAARWRINKSNYFLST